MRIEVIHPKELGVDDAARWRAHRAADASLASPYLSPEWARFVGAARDDARVCLIDGGEGFLGVQRVSRFSAMGLGAPIADYQGVVGAEGLLVDGRDLCRALKVGRVDLTHVPPNQSILKKPAGEDGAWIADVSRGAEAYQAELKARRGEFVRQTYKKARKLEREHGALDFVADSRNDAHFETLLKWKNAQLKKSGQPQIWANPWVRKVVRWTFASTKLECAGALFTFTLGDRLVAASYFLRSETVLHDWIIAHDPEFDAYSPGVLLALKAIEWAGENGMSEVDFGPGGYQFKRQLATGQRALKWGSISGVSVSGVVRSAQYGLRSAIERAPSPKLAALPGKAMRRFDLMRGLAA